MEEDLPGAAVAASVVEADSEASAEVVDLAQEAVAPAAVGKRCLRQKYPDLNFKFQQKELI